MHRFATKVRNSILCSLGETLFGRTGETYEVRLVNYIPTLIIKKRNDYLRRDGQQREMFEEHPYTDAIWRFMDTIKEMDLRYSLELAKFGLGKEMKDLRQFIVFNRVGTTEAGGTEGTV